MYNVKDPEEMTAEERMREMVQILAMGYLRLRKHSPYLGDEGPNDDAQKDINSEISKSSSPKNHPS